MSRKVSIIGLGKLGSCMAAAYASKGHEIIGVDINSDFVDKVNKGQAPVKEKDLDKYISENSSKIEATQDFEYAITNTDITFIIVPTPTDKSGGFSVEYVEKACEDIGKALSKKDSYHLVILTSTVLPTDSEEKIIPILEKFSGKKCGVDFGYCYSPEFIAIGTVLRDLLNPDFFLVGEFDQKSGDLLEKFYSTVSDNGSSCRRMNIASAELTKISVNSFLTMKITYANMLAEIAENIPGVDVDDVTGAIGSDIRIGKHYLKGGLGFGGPCFPRDNRAFAYMAENRGIKVPYAAKTDEYNKHIIQRSVELVKNSAEKDLKIGILGMSYKTGTSFSEESQSLLIAKQLSSDGYTVNVFEPFGNDHAEYLLGDLVNYSESIEDCLNNSDLLFVAALDSSYSDLPELLKNSNIKILIDPWRQFTELQNEENIKYIPFGLSL